MILTYKVKHHRDFSEELRKAKQVAEFAVKHLGLKSMIANQILRKYGGNKAIRKVTHVKLTVPNQGIKVDLEKQIITVPCLKLSFPYEFPNGFEKINQIEVGTNYIYVSVSIPENPPIQPESFLGVDLNTTGHVAVVANPTTGKVWKLGKQAEYIHKKYKHIRKALQKQWKYRKVKQIKNRESLIVRDLNHKISEGLVRIAHQNTCGIKLESLKDIRKTTKQAKSFRYSLNSWSSYQLQQFIAYKAKLQGIPVVYIDPAYTSQTCSKCAHRGNRNRKSFKCLSCGHVENADVNAAINIARRPSLEEDISQFDADRDVSKGSTDTPK